MKNSRLLLIIPALLISSCGDAQSYGKKITLEKAKEVYEDINDEYKISDGWVVSFSQEMVEGKDDNKTTQKMRYKAKKNATSLYLNYRLNSQSNGDRTNIHNEYYVFPDEKRHEILYVKSENLITEQKTEIAIDNNYYYYGYSSTLINEFRYISEFEYATQYSYPLSMLQSLMRGVDEEDGEEEENKYEFYSSRKGDLTIKYDFKLKSQKTSFDYEATKKGSAIFTFKDYKCTKLSANMVTVYGNKQTINIEYSYPKSIKIEPPDGWEDNLVGSSVSSTSSKSTW